MPAPLAPSVAVKAVAKAPSEESRGLIRFHLFLSLRLALSERSYFVHTALEANDWQIPAPDGILPTRKSALLAIS
jgi:hypothetical protein